MENNLQLKKNQIFNEKKRENNEINLKELYDLYKKEFINCCESILIVNQNDFLDGFYDKMNLIIKNEFSENIFEENVSLYSSKKQCENNFVVDIYWPMRNLCSSSLQNYSEKKNKSKNFLINFRPHCIYDEVPLHTCGSKFIQIFEENNKKNILYVVCTGCHKCYYSNCIRMSCHYCQINFYSEIINFQNNLFPATWKEYHCHNENILNNEQMHCINCNGLLYIQNIKLYCKNCKKIFDPQEIIWTCKICNKDFKSEIKIYNPFEFKEIELAKRDAILYKKVAKPNYLPCNCISKYDIDNYEFCHEPKGQCKGLLLYSYINEKEFLVCFTCKKIYELNKFHWNCPLCFKKFVINELRFFIYHKKNNYYKNNLIYTRTNTNNSGKKINNSNSQKVIGSDILNEEPKVYHKNNSYIKKRINSCCSSYNNSANNSLEKYEESSENSKFSNNKKRKALSIILNNDNKGNNLNNITNSSNKENNSITNKYNIGSTAHSSHLNNNNIKKPQTARKITDSSLYNKEKINIEQKSNINRYIDEKILNIPITTINKKKYINPNKKLYINTKPYRTIEEYISNFNSNEYTRTNYFNTSFKNNDENDNPKNNKIGDNMYLNDIKKKFKKYQKIDNKEISFYENINKSFISQKTDMKINQVYIPKKHINRTSAPTTPLYRDKQIKSYYSNINEKNDNNFIKYDSNFKTNYNHSCEKRNLRYININNFNKNNINKNIEKLRELSGPRIYPILNKNFFESKINKTNNNHNITMIQPRGNLNDINYKEKKKLLNNHRNYTNIHYNLTENNNKLTSTLNSNNSNGPYNEKNKINKIANNKKDRFTNRNINYKYGNNKGKSFITSNEKFNSNILNGSIESNNNHSNLLNKKYIPDNQHTNIIRKKYKNNYINNDALLSKYKKLISKNIQSRKNNNQNIQNRNAKKSGLFEYINSNSKTDTINKNKNNNYNKKKFNKNNNKNINNKDKEEEILKQKEKIIDDKNILNNDENEEDELKVFNFDEYKIITQLGQGSFGKIYLVQNSKKELFTMKKLVYSEELDVQTVIKEYKMCYKLKHPNVVKILGIYSNKLDKTTYVVYVLMEVGLTDWEKEIKTHIEKKIFYQESELNQILKQIINVLSFLQKQNISHRDIKPQNILVFKNNIYKVADFGEAKQIENMTMNLACNSLRGTELYMSPLLFNGLRTGQVDIRHNVFKSDVYSLGLCILFAGSLEMMSLYDIRKYVEMEDAKKYLNKMFKDRYSSKFINLLSMLLEIHENKRPDFIDLETILNDY